VKALRFARGARREIDIVVGYSRRRFGDDAARRYRALVRLALLALRENPDRHGAARIDDDSLQRRPFHLRHARLLAPARERVAKPRHMLLFRVTEDHLIVLRLLHDSMDIEAHLAATTEDESDAP